MKTLPAFFFAFTTAFFTSGLGSGLWAQDADLPPPPTRDQNFMQTFLMIAVAMLFFYFILWRPEQKRKQALEEQKNSLQKGCRVTAMGILGTVVRVEKETVILKMYDGAKIEVLKGAITDVEPHGDASEPSQEKDKEASSS